MATPMKLEIKDHREVYVSDPNGSAYIIRNWLPSEDADLLLSLCQQLDTIQHNFQWFGRPLKQTRKNWACGDVGVIHQFGGVTVPVHEWTEAPALEQIRDRIHFVLGVYTNFCLVNHYATGKDSIALHSDSELFADNKSVLTISLGTSRMFQLKHLSGLIHDFTLHHGDMFVMNGNVQIHWKHGLPADPTVTTARYSLTYRGARQIKV